MRRREFIAAVGVGMAVWPLAAAAQPPAMPVGGFLASGSADGYAYGLPLLREVVPKATLIAVLVNPNNPTAIPDTTEMQVAGRSIGVTIEVVHAGSERELDDAFAKAAQLRADALIVHIDALFQARDKQVV